MAATLIDDGYTRDGYIAAATPEPNGERLHGDVTFKYRVATKRDLIRHEAAVKKALTDDTDAEAKLKAEEIACQFVVDRVSEWDVTTSKGQAAKVSVDNLLRIHPLIFSSLYSMVRGWKTSDPRPKVDNPQPELTDEEQVKNSEAVSG